MSSETVRPSDVDWDGVAFVTASQYREEAIRALHGTTDNPTGISRRRDASSVKYAQALSSLRDRGFVATVPDRGTDREVYYELTDTGRRIHRALDGDVAGAPPELESPVDWDHIGFVDSSKGRRAVIQRLSVAPATPSRITDSSDDIVIADVSHALSQLREEGLVELLVDEDRRKGRYYGLTGLGQSVAAALQEVTGDE